MKRTAVLLVLSAVTLTGCAGFRGSKPIVADPIVAAQQKPTPCADVIPGCHAKRLPNVTLTDGHTDGALGPIDGIDTTGILSFDEALRRAGAQDQHDGKTVRVILGAADADKDHWGHGTNLYYAIEWAGMRMCPSMPLGVGAPQPRCVKAIYGTVIDAKTGRFIVAGEGTTPPADHGA